MTKRPSIAIVGLAGIFPGAADAGQYWRNIAGKIDATDDVPAERWIVAVNSVIDNEAGPDKAFHGRACLIRDFTLDAGGFHLDPSVVQTLDPLYHLVLHAGRAALRDVRPNRDTTRLPRETTGVILAAIALPTETASTVSRSVLAGAMEKRIVETTGAQVKPAHKNPAFSGTGALGARVTGFPAAILARALGLGGGTYTLDAACASSLFSIKLACDELASHRADMMLAGGVSRPDCLYTQIGFSQLRALSPTGRCAPFDAAADGLMVGEGCGILVLKRLDDARRDGDRIHGLIRGIGLSNDIGGNLLAPDAQGQLRAMRQAYAEAGWSPRDVDLIECHGAGTPVGDTTELESLKALWGETGWRKHQCAIGSVKSMIGHLLTAAGAAGLIKILLALKHGTLPPTLHHRNPPAGSPLENGPFHVQTEASPWLQRDTTTPRRAAVSAFGFGGINAHLLVEEWLGEKENALPSETAPAAISADEPVAVVGMAATIGPLTHLRQFQESVFNGRPAFIDRPSHRWKGMDAHGNEVLGGTGRKGAFLDSVPLEVGQFHIPPNEIPDIIPQHLLMLKVAAEALTDAGLPPRADRPGMGVIIGMGFDMEATNYHLRWAASAGLLPLPLSGELNETPRNELKAGCSPPLTSAGVLGALGSMVASRIAKEFRFGAPGFVVSCEEASGLKALEIGIRRLQLREADAMLIGAVEMTGDLRQMMLNHEITPYADGDEVFSFDKNAAGTLPGEGAVALVVKRLDSALRDGDRIYGVINAIGGASGETDFKSFSKEAFSRSLKRSLAACASPAGSTASPGSSTSPGIELFEMSGWGNAVTDRAEGEALTAFPFTGKDLPDDSERIAIGALAPVTGHTGAVSGLASVVKTCLCLYQEILPPTGRFVTPPAGIWDETRFFIPAYPQYWVHNRVEGPRTACVSAFTTDGNCMHVLLSDPPASAAGKTISPGNKCLREKTRPLGDLPRGLFVITGDDTTELLSGLDALSGRFPPATASDESMDAAARNWFHQNGAGSGKKLAVTIVAESVAELHTSLEEAKTAVKSRTARTMSRWGGVRFSPAPMRHSGEIAFVFPGSGNHWVGMGRETAVRWPEVMRSMSDRTGELKTQMLPRFYVPQRLSWESGWEMEARDLLSADPLHLIFGQVVYGGMMSDLIRRFDIRPEAVIGYSLGETVGNFALGAWKDRGEMLARMRSSDLFSTQLAGSCLAARSAWQIPASDPFDWYVAAVNRPANVVRQLLEKYRRTRLLIVNTPDECVIGGLRDSVLAALKDLGGEAVYVEGVVTVHCDAVTPVAGAYRELHVFPTSPPEGIRFYSCALGDSHKPTSDGAAQSILDQARYGFDFPKTIRKAYADGVRVFLEMGPHNSCSRMIDRILEGKPHLCVSASTRGENESLSVLKFLATLISARIPVDLAYLYADAAFPPNAGIAAGIKASRMLIRPVGDILRIPVMQPAVPPAVKIPPASPETIPVPAGAAIENSPGSVFAESTDESPPDTDAPASPFWHVITSFEKQAAATAEAHEKFLEFSNELTRSYAETYAYQMRLFEALISGTPPAAASPAEFKPPLPGDTPPDSGLDSPEPLPGHSPGPLPAFSREMCLEFATGSAEKVLGPLFAPVDTYRARVRLPDQPLMLVDRILSIEGTKGEPGPGKIVTEHDVLPDAWYLDGGHAPVCISVEAGQADLFLCAYMGIDLKVKGERSYRLLDATVDFFRGLPKPGETIRYDIEIERFARQGETYLFFFHFDGFIGNEHLIRMRNGCAGFFTETEVVNSGGILFTESERLPRPGVTPPGWTPPAPMKAESYDEAAVNALRKGDLATCFGPAFTGKSISKALWLPGGRMRLIHRILSLEPAGGRYGIGCIRAEADIHADDWFLTCHFVDDRVMPGTLMYECCAHTLRVFVQRLGWISDKPGACYEPVIGVRSRLKCRGPVTPGTKKVVYEIEIKELGYGPEPYVTADALMYADEHRIVYFEDMALKLSGVTREEIDALWGTEKARSETSPLVFDEAKVLAFAEGNPSEAFGPPYQKFDTDRFIARLPRPPYSLIHRVTAAEPAPWELAPGGWITAEYDVPPDAWYFKANRTHTLPISILLEIALQPCGWLAAYAGSALKSEKELRFRNLGGKAELLRDVTPGGDTITTRARLTKVSAAGEMIIEFFDFEVSHAGAVFYRGNTNFGFFSVEALSTQVGLGKTALFIDGDGSRVFPEPVVLPLSAPILPDEDGSDAPAAAPYRLEMPAKAILMIDRIEYYSPKGGPAGLGYIRGIKTVDPNEWFFAAHFHQDPVCPGSLGIESFLQLLRFDALNRWPSLASSHRVELVSPGTHEWTYRGQVTARCKTVTVEAMITRITEDAAPTIMANGYLHVDGLCIYKMDNFGIRLAPVTGRYGC
ncbi:MAG: beta-ketoacyl synthase N-terminal-like domain-containing protein [Pseudomonadota bacterium]